MQDKLPVIDLSKCKGSFTNDLNSIDKDVIDTLWYAASTYGFFYVKNHNIDLNSIQNIFDISKHFFACPVEEKSQYKVEDNIGYCSLGTERLSEKHQLDLKEAFNLTIKVGLESRINNLPKVLKDNVDLLLQFNKDCHELVVAILRLLALTLELPLNYFDEAHNLTKESGTIMRILHYPKLETEVDSKTTIRAGSHSDYGSLTLLFQQDEGKDVESGLQILKSDTSKKGSKDDADEEWISIASKPGCIVVNIADLLSIWTEGRLKSAVHRVVLPQTSNLQNKPRYSITYFSHPKSDLEIFPTPSPKPPIHKAVVNESGDLEASFGVSKFIYGETDGIYLGRRIQATYNS